MKSCRHALHFFALTGVFVLLALSPAHANTIWYVNASATGSNNGTSWTNAFTTVESAIAAASIVLDAGHHADQIWVAKGTYHPPVSGGASNGYTISHPLDVYGGFKGTETTLSGRAGYFIATVLDGTQTILGTTIVANHVVGITNVAGAYGHMGVVIDGFKITRGNASTTGADGGGVSSIDSDIAVANSFVWSNTASSASGFGGGLYFTSLNGGIYPTTGNILNIKDCEFKDNQSSYGGAIYGDDGQGEIVNTKVLGNTSGYGGGVYLTHMGSSNTIDFTNCEWWGNVTTGASAAGGGLYLDAVGNAYLVNCTFNSNIASSGLDGQALFVNTYSSATIYNSIFWLNNSDGLGVPAPIVGSATVNYSDVEGGHSGSNNKNADPVFTNAGADTLTLQSTSPCIDCADYSVLPLDDLDVDNDGDSSEVMPLDLAYRMRMFQDINVNDTGNPGHNCGGCLYLDMGAYEFQ